MRNKIKITQIRSSIGIIPKHKATLMCLGLRRIGHTVRLNDTPSIRGMIKLISYLIRLG